MSAQAQGKSCRTRIKNRIGCDYFRWTVTDGASGPARRARDHAPDDKDNDRPGHGADQAGAFASAIPPARLTQIGRYEGADYAENGGEYEPDNRR